MAALIHMSIHQLLKFGAKFGFRCLIAKYCAKILIKCTNPLAITADVAQSVLEVSGNGQLGKYVGLWGNVISVIMIGLAYKERERAISVATGGLIVWVAGEVVGEVCEKASSLILN